MTALKELFNYLFPPVCSSCKKEGEFLCKKCISGLNISGIKPISHHPSSLEFKYLDGVIYGLDYGTNPAIKAAVRQFKYRFTKELVEYFGGLIADKLKQLRMNRGKTLVLIPVPLHRRRLHYRGFNQAELIARSVSEKFGERIEVRTLLKRIRHTSQQAKLSKLERQENLDSAFVIDDFEYFDNFLEGRLFFVVDDVCTTGATLDNCAKVLKKAGVGKVYGLVVARAFK